MEHFHFQSYLLQVSKYYSIVPEKVISHSYNSLVAQGYSLDHQKNVIIKIGTSSKKIKNEIKCLSQLSHPNIIVLITSYIWPVRGGSVVLENSGGISLGHLLKEEGKLHEKEASFVTNNLTKGINYLHSKGWIHRDLHPENIIYNRHEPNVKLIDFEFSTRVNKWLKVHRSKKGHENYRSPEMNKGLFYGVEVDVWSLGVITFLLVAGRFPFPISKRKVKEKGVKKKDQKLIIPKDISTHCEDFLKKIFIERIKTTTPLLEHLWINNEQQEQEQEQEHLEQEQQAKQEQEQL